jgi:hypothetical protein
MPKTIVEAKPLSEYKDAQSQTRRASGVKSPNSDREMQVILPLISHPELPGLVKALDVDPESGKQWTGWVKYSEPPAVVVPKEPEVESAMSKYMRALTKLEQDMKLVKLGVFGESELLINDQRAALKELYRAAWK